MLMAARSGTCNSAHDLLREVVINVRCDTDNPSPTSHLAVSGSATPSCSYLSSSIFPPNSKICFFPSRNASLHMGAMPQNRGSVVYSVMVCLGEMVSYLPIPGGHVKLAERFVNPAFSLALGWNYWYSWCVCRVLCYQISYFGLFCIFVLLNRLTHSSCNQLDLINRRMTGSSPSLMNCPQQPYSSTTGSRIQL